MKWNGSSMVRLAVTRSTLELMTPEVSGSQTHAVATVAVALAALDCSTTLYLHPTAVTAAVKRLCFGPEEIGFIQN